MLLAARALRTDCEAPLDGDGRARLGRVEEWGVQQIDSGTDGMAAKPAYELAEYLVAASLLLVDPPPACAR
jgi:hypothetical protein